MNDPASREAQINVAFVAVADTLTTDFDVVELLHTLVEQCVGIVDTDTGGLMLVDGNGDLQLMTSTSEDADSVEIMQLAASTGPCIDCFRTGTAVSVPDIAQAGGRWPDFERAALERGLHSAHATPMRLRGQIVGTMNLFSSRPGALSERDAALTQALTDVATIALLQDRVVQEGTLLAEQLHRALDSRILIEQAKGMIAHSLSLSMDDAFVVLRTHARSNNLTIRAVADAISNRELEVAALQPRTAL